MSEQIHPKGVLTSQKWAVTHVHVYRVLYFEAMYVCMCRCSVCTVYICNSAVNYISYVTNNIARTTAIMMHLRNVWYAIMLAD